MITSRNTYKTPLYPAEVFYTLAGAFNTQNYQLIRRIDVSDISDIDENNNLQLRTLAMIFQSPTTNKLHILYYPGKDNDKEGTDIPLKKLATMVRSKINHLISENALPAYNLEEMVEHFIISESNTYLGINVAHYVGAIRQNNQLYIEDSIDRNYNTDYIESALKLSNNTTNKFLTGQQSITNNWQCGHFAIELHRRNIEITKNNNEFKEYKKEFKVNKAVCLDHQNLLNEAKNLLPKDEKADDNSDDFSMEDDKPTPSFKNTSNHQQIAKQNNIGKDIKKGIVIALSVFFSITAIVGVGLLTGGVGVPIVAGIILLGAIYYNINENSLTNNSNENKVQKSSTYSIFTDVLNNINNKEQEILNKIYSVMNEKFPNVVRRIGQKNTEDFVTELLIIYHSGKPIGHIDTSNWISLNKNGENIENDKNENEIAFLLQQLSLIKELKNHPSNEEKINFLNKTSFHTASGHKQIKNHDLLTMTRSAFFKANETYVPIPAGNKTLQAEKNIPLKKSIL